MLGCGNSIFFKNKYDKTVYLYVDNVKNNILCIFLRLSSFYYSSSMVDNYSYNTVYKFFNNKANFNNNSMRLLFKNINILVTRFFVLNTGLTLTLFNNPSTINNTVNKLKSLTYNKLKSSESLFLSFNWSEREVSEMNNVFFLFKLDTRNLLLIYGDLLNPLLKKTPTIGYLEYSYVSFLDLIVKSLCDSY